MAPVRCRDPRVLRHRSEPAQFNIGEFCCCICGTGVKYSWCLSMCVCVCVCVCVWCPQVCWCWWSPGVLMLLVAVIGDCGACNNSKTALGVVSITANTTASVKNQNNSKTQTSSLTGQIHTHLSGEAGEVSES